MEGWYYRLTLVEEKISFAFIISIEDPGIKCSELNLACIQVVGPEDGYLVQASKDDTKFWASRNEQSLGYTFEYQNEREEEEIFKFATKLDIEHWKQIVKSGFQVSPNRLIGRVNGHDGSDGGVLEGQGIGGTCEFDFHITPICGWGSCTSTKSGSSETQKSTGGKFYASETQKCQFTFPISNQSMWTSTKGWLSSFPIFEPHWQVTLADARASGTVIWNGTRYDFSNEPFYAEKNWGAALPCKWYWTQCNSFDGYDQLSVTAGGGIRKLPFGQQESLGMISVHHNYTFYEAVPWKGSMEWNVSTWGYWGLRGECLEGDKKFAVEIEYSCDPVAIPGLVFRAPTPDEGMVYFCRDTFDAKCILSLWELELDADSQIGKAYKRKEPPIIDRALSTQGGAEIGGGPWWSEWSAKSKLKRVIKTLLNLPKKLSLRRH
jgi:tocopherol cyclase